MIGNDIIDLKFANINSRWREPRFLDKLFTEEEKDFILRDANHFRHIWLLWSMKESVYKIYFRERKLSIFNPKSFHCNVISETSGTVSFENDIVHTTSKITSNIIYTTAELQDTLHLKQDFLLKGNSLKAKSEALREKAITAFAEFKSIPKTSVSIEKNDFGAPQFFLNGKLQNNFLSLTHHGQYGGFAISY